MKKNRLLIIGAVISVAFLSIFGINSVISSQPANVESVYFSYDVNPSFDISYNDETELVSVIPMNNDGIDLIFGQELNDVQLDYALATLTSLAYDAGYLDEDSNEMILLSASSLVKDEIKEQATLTINNTISDLDISTTLLVDDFTTTDELITLSEDLNVSLGKAKFLSSNYSETEIQQHANNSITSIALEKGTEKYQQYSHYSQNSEKLINDYANFVNEKNNLTELQNKLINDYENKLMNEAEYQEIMAKYSFEYNNVVSSVNNYRDQIENNNFSIDIITDDIENDLINAENLEDDGYSNSNNEDTENVDSTKDDDIINNDPNLVTDSTNNNANPNDASPGKK